MNDTVKQNLPTVQNQSLPAQRGPNPMTQATDEEGSFDKLLKFKRGVYYVGKDEVVPAGTTYRAHCIAWTKVWIKFHNGERKERLAYPVVTWEGSIMKAGPRPPDREQLDELARDDTGAPLPNDKQPSWEPGLDGRPADPWVYQYLLPLETDDGEIVVFATASIGGKRSVSDLCRLWGRRYDRTGGTCGMPIIAIGVGNMPSKRFGNIPKPIFNIKGWDDNNAGIRDFSPPDTLKQEMDDEIPF